MTTAREEFRKGQVRKFVWKRVEMYRFADKLLVVALDKPPEEPWFGADEVVDNEFVYDPRTAGCVINALKDAGIIVACMIQVDEKRGILMGRRLAKRDSRHSARVQLWQLRNRSLAVQWRRENADLAAIDPRSPELFSNVPFDHRPPGGGASVNSFPVMAPTPTVIAPSGELPLGLPRPIIGAGTD